MEENQYNGIKRIRLELRKEQKEYPSSSGEKRRERNKKHKQNSGKLRGKLEFYYDNDSDKIELFNKIDNIKLFLGEGKFNKVSTFELLHRLCDFFANLNLPGADNMGNENLDFEPEYQYCTLEAAKSEELFIGCLSSVQKLVSQVQAHDAKCHEKLVKTRTKNVHGVLSVKMTCQESHAFNWTSSPHLENGKYLASAKFCHGYLSSGILPNQFQKLCEASDIADFGDTYINEMLDSYTVAVENEATISKHKALQDEIAMTAALLSDDDHLTGINIVTDARHCWRKNAKFSDVVCLGKATNKCIQIETVTKTDDPSSQRHELVGVRRLYDYFDQNDCPVNIHAHDNNNQITKFVREERRPTQNASDTWHMTKGIAKAAKKITPGFKSTMGLVWHEELADKAAAIKTHTFHSMKNCKNDADVLRKNILNFIDHYTGSHENCLETSRCKTDRNYECSKYTIKDEKAISILTDFLKSMPVYKDAEKYKYCMDTHYVESFNNALLQYVDKRICFGLNTYKMRINFAILDWNENVDRPFTSKRQIPYKRDPARTYSIPVKKRKTAEFKINIWNKWLEHFYN